MSDNFSPDNSANTSSVGDGLNTNTGVNGVNASTGVNGVNANTGVNGVNASTDVNGLNTKTSTNINGDKVKDIKKSKESKDVSNTDTKDKNIIDSSGDNKNMRNARPNKGDRDLINDRKDKEENKNIRDISYIKITGNGGIQYFDKYRIDVDRMRSEAEQYVRALMDEKIKKTKLEFIPPMELVDLLPPRVRENLKIKNKYGDKNTDYKYDDKNSGSDRDGKYNDRNNDSKYNDRNNDKSGDISKDNKYSDRISDRISDRNNDRNNDSKYIDKKDTREELTWQKIKELYIADRDKKHYDWQKKCAILREQWDNVQDIFTNYLSHKYYAVTAGGYKPMSNIQNQKSIGNQNQNQKTNIDYKQILSNPIILDTLTFEQTLSLKEKIENDLTSKIKSTEEYDKDLNKFLDEWKLFNEYYIKLGTLFRRRMEHIKDEEERAYQDIDNQYVEFKKYLATLKQPTNEYTVNVLCQHSNRDYTRRARFYVNDKVGDFVENFLSDVNSYDRGNQVPYAFVVQGRKMIDDLSMKCYNLAIIDTIKIEIFDRSNIDGDNVNNLRDKFIT